MISKGQIVKFKTSMGAQGEGEVEDFTEHAVVILSPIFGRMIIEHSEIIKPLPESGIVKIDNDFQYATITLDNTYDPNKHYGQFGYLSPDIDDDGC